ncbi:hypothetical protein ABI59_12590 [Acidobacteria bacterium Mor1]|nr:hypothetical protein ABI59_12590 [Acidobacteria bacterium Mor1]
MSRRLTARRPFLALTALLILGGCAEEPVVETVLRPVRSETVMATGSARSRTFSGTARASQETELSFRVNGRIERLAVKVGDTVRRNQLIARLEPRDFEIAVNQAEAALAQSQATFRNAESDLERIRGLWENNNASQTELDQATAGFQSARAAVDAAQQSLESVKRQLSYSALRAPVGGSIAAVNVEVNENVGNGQAIVLLTSGERPEVEVAIPEVMISQIHKGDAVTIGFDALEGEFPGVVTEVGVASTANATTFPVTARLERENPDIRFGMAANVTFRFSGEDRQRILLPSHAVAADDDGSFVFVLEASGETGVVRRRGVEVGPLTADGLEILSGVEVGEQVVTAGVARLTDGQQVKLPRQS